jgi:hypothetical protein
MRVSAVATVVLASTGGARLANALASVAWGGERIVLDPAARLTRESLPRGVRLHTGAAEPADLTAAPWVLLLGDGELASPGLAAAIGAVVAEGSARSAYRIPLDVEGFGVSLRTWRAPVRLARRSEARLRTGPGLLVELGRSTGRPGRLAAPLVERGTDRLSDAVEQIDAQAATLAALLAVHRRPPRLRDLVFGSLAAGGRALVARPARFHVMARWFIAVLSGYRAAVAYAKLWERSRAEGW